MQLLLHCLFKKYSTPLTVIAPTQPVLFSYELYGSQRFQVNQALRIKHNYNKQNKKTVTQVNCLSSGSCIYNDSFAWSIFIFALSLFQKKKGFKNGLKQTK